MANLILDIPELQMPPEDAQCHRGICSQDKCGRCSRIRQARAAIVRLTDACQRAWDVETSVTQGQERERRVGYCELLRHALDDVEAPF